MTPEQSIEDLKAKLTETTASGGFDLGLPILDVSIENGVES